MPKGFELLVLLVCSLTLEKCKHCLCKFKAQSNLKPAQNQEKKSKTSSTQYLCILEPSVGHISGHPSCGCGSSRPDC